MRFEGFGAGAVAWFEGLERDNAKRYMDATRATFEDEVRGPLEALLVEVAAGVGGEVKVFRQNRDVRFSPDKSPYKTATYGVVHRPGTDAGLYAAISSAGLYAGTGYYQMARDQLERYRAAVDDDASGGELAALVDAVEAAGLVVEGDGLRTVPRGFPRDHPRRELLRRTSLILGARLAPGPALGDRRALEHARSTWAATAPVTAWLDRNVGPSALPPEERVGRRGR
ncbi:MAG: DUF2461 domain-containing protein [Thermoleophilia bacterium]